MRIPVDGISVRLEGDLDLRGFLGVDDSVRPGYLSITGTVTLESSASETDLARLKKAVMAAMGMSMGPMRPPSLPHSAEELEELRGLLRGFGWPVPEETGAPT